MSGGQSTVLPVESDRDRAQSSIVGVALLLGATVIALGVLTASVGTMIDGHVARTDANRVAGDLDEAIRPVETTGHHSAPISFSDGRLYTVERQLRIRDGSGPVVNPIEIGGLVYERGQRRVRSVAGAVVRGRHENAWTVSPPPIFGSESNGVLVVGATMLNASQQSVGGGDVRATVSTNVSHERKTRGPDTFRVAIETSVPAAFEASLRNRGGIVLDRRDYDRDGIDSAVVRFPGSRVLYLVDHDMRLEVTDD